MVILITTYEKERKESGMKQQREEERNETNERARRPTGRDDCVSVFVSFLFLFLKCAPRTTGRKQGTRRRSTKKEKQSLEENLTLCQELRFESLEEFELVVSSGDKASDRPRLAILVYHEQQHKMNTERKKERKECSGRAAKKGERRE